MSLSDQSTHNWGCLIGTVFMWLVGYLLLSFVSLGFSPVDWHSATRFAYIIWFGSWGWFLIKEVRFP